MADVVEARLDQIPEALIYQRKATDESAGRQAQTVEVGTGSGVPRSPVGLVTANLRLSRDFAPSRLEFLTRSWTRLKW